MSTRLQSIPVIVEQPESSYGNVEPLLHEIRHALAQLLKDGTSTFIDLMALPLARGEEEQILTLLGRGEVRAELTVLGSSEVLETAYPGVWLVTHRDEQGELQARFIEVTQVPEILRSQPSDIASGLERLRGQLSSS